MLAVKFVEVAIIRRVMLRTVPPVPVAALGNQDLLEGEISLRLGSAGCSFGVKLAGAMEVVPRLVIFRSADPNVKVGVDPRSGNERM